MAGKFQSQTTAGGGYAYEGQDVKQCWGSDLLHRNGPFMGVPFEGSFGMRPVR